jgi:hypothetical protein
VRAVAEVVAPLLDANGSLGGCLRVAVLPQRVNASSASLWGPDDSSVARDGVSALEIVEGYEYRYEWQLGATIEHVQTDPVELFQPDSWKGLTGRLRPGLATGAIQVSLRTNERVLGRLEIEVRSRKLAYQSEYQWMLRDIAAQMTELIMDRFAASEARFEQDETRDAVTLYQRFAFLRALLRSDSFQVALREILRRPHVAWEVRSEWVRPGVGLRAESHVLRQLCRGGPRTAWTGGPLASVPAVLERRRTEATHDKCTGECTRPARGGAGADAA